MIKKDKILAEAREIEYKIQMCRKMINEMCDDLDKEDNFERKEMILQTIKSAMKDFNSLIEMHYNKLEEL